MNGAEFFIQDSTWYIIAAGALAALPFTELRLALPIALTAMGLSPLIAYVATVIGNILPVIFLLLFLPAFVSFARTHIPFIDRFFTWWFHHVTVRYQKRLQMWGMLALMLFVAIPLPMTGAWTGSVAAYLFRLPRFTSFIYIAIGVMISGVVITALTLGTVSIF